MEIKLHIDETEIVKKILGDLYEELKKEFLKESSTRRIKTMINHEVRKQIRERLNKEDIV